MASPNSGSSSQPVQAAAVPISSTLAIQPVDDYANYSEDSDSDPSSTELEEVNDYDENTTVAVGKNGAKKRKKRKSPTNANSTKTGAAAVLNFDIDREFQKAGFMSYFHFLALMALCSASITSAMTALLQPWLLIHPEEVERCTIYYHHGPHGLDHTIDRVHKKEIPEFQCEITSYDDDLGMCMEDQGAYYMIHDVEKNKVVNVFDAMVAASYTAAGDETDKKKESPELHLVPHHRVFYRSLPHQEHLSIITSFGFSPCDASYSLTGISWFAGCFLGVAFFAPQSDRFGRATTMFAAIMIQQIAASYLPLIGLLGGENEGHRVNGKDSIVMHSGENKDSRAGSSSSFDRGNIGIDNDGRWMDGRERSMEDKLNGKRVDDEDGMVGMRGPWDFFHWYSFMGESKNPYTSRSLALSSNHTDNFDDPVLRNLQWDQSISLTSTAVGDLTLEFFPRPPLSGIHNKHFLTFVFLRGLIGFASVTWSTICYIMAVEVSPNAHRTKFTTSSNLAFSVGLMMVAGLAYLFRDNWRYLCFVICLYGYFSAGLLYCFTRESPYWLLSQGDTVELKKWFKAFKKRNRQGEEIYIFGKRVFSRRKRRNSAGLLVSYRRGEALPVAVNSDVARIDRGVLKKEKGSDSDDFVIEDEGEGGTKVVNSVTGKNLKKKEVRGLSSGSGKRDSRLKKVVDEGVKTDDSKAGNSITGSNLDSSAASITGGSATSATVVGAASSENQTSVDLLDDVESSAAYEMNFFPTSNFNNPFEDVFKKPDPATVDENEAPLTAQLWLGIEDVFREGEQVVERGLDTVEKGIENLKELNPLENPVGGSNANSNSGSNRNSPVPANAQASSSSSIDNPLSPGGSNLNPNSSAAQGAAALKTLEIAAPVTNTVLKLNPVAPVRQKQKKLDGALDIDLVHGIGPFGGVPINPFSDGETEEDVNEKLIVDNNDSTTIDVDSNAVEDDNAQIQAAQTRARGPINAIRNNSFEDNLENRSRGPIIALKSKPKKPGLITAFKTLIMNEDTRKPLLVLMVLWFICSFLYFGLSFGVEDLGRAVGSGTVRPVNNQGAIHDDHPQSYGGNTSRSKTSYRSRRSLGGATPQSHENHITIGSGDNDTLDNPNEGENADSSAHWLAFLMAITEAPAYFISMILMNKFGRRKTLIGLFGVAGFSCGICAIMMFTTDTKFSLQKKNNTAVTTSEMTTSSTTTFVTPPSFLFLGIPQWATLAKFCMTSAFATIYVLGSETFKTNVRVSAMALQSSCARIGGMATAPAYLVDRLFGVRGSYMMVFSGAGIGAGWVSMMKLKEKERGLMKESAVMKQNRPKDGSINVISRESDLDRRLQNQQTGAVAQGTNQGSTGIVTGMPVPRNSDDSPQKSKKTKNAKNPQASIVGRREGVE